MDFVQKHCLMHHAVVRCNKVVHSIDSLLGVFVGAHRATTSVYSYYAFALRHYANAHSLSFGNQH